MWMIYNSVWQRVELLGVSERFASSIITLRTIAPGAHCSKVKYPLHVFDSVITGVSHRTGGKITGCHRMWLSPTTIACASHG